MVPDPFFSLLVFCRQKETSGVLNFYFASQVVSELYGEDGWDAACRFSQVDGGLCSLHLMSDSRAHLVTQTGTGTLVGVL